MAGNPGYSSGSAQGSWRYIDHVRVRDRIELDWGLPTPRYTFQLCERLEDAVTQLIEMYNSAFDHIVPKGICHSQWLKRDAEGKTESDWNRRIKAGDLVKVRRLRFDKKEEGYARTWIDENENYFTRCLFEYDGQTAKLRMTDQASLSLVLIGVPDRERVKVPQDVGDFALVDPEMKAQYPWFGIVLQVSEFGELEKGSVAVKSRRDPRSRTARF